MVIISTWMKKNCLKQISRMKWEEAEPSHVIEVLKFQKCYYVPKWPLCFREYYIRDLNLKSTCMSLKRGQKYVSIYIYIYILFTHDIFSGSKSICHNHCELLSKLVT